MGLILDGKITSEKIKNDLKKKISDRDRKNWKKTWTRDNSRRSRRRK